MTAANIQYTHPCRFTIPLSSINMPGKRRHEEEEEEEEEEEDDEKRRKKRLKNIKLFVASSILRGTRLDLHVLIALIHVSSTDIEDRLEMYNEVIELLKIGEEQRAKKIKEREEMARTELKNKLLDLYRECKALGFSKAKCLRLEPDLEPFFDD